MIEDMASMHNGVFYSRLENNACKRTRARVTASLAGVV